ncbi:LuxR C-terminal-related transcriptional regulator [Actinomadura sp. NTSP31]|uniref:helix-turn-helix transcriptional regulator n=1 Tax=Actinomadura sp. NTSP31 TaxID=1735447 RepID=UPI0035C0C954
MPRNHRIRRRRSSAAEVPSTVDGIAVTKLRAPEPRDEWISRSALVRSLTNARTERLFVIAAPAGYGKSTLAAQWRTDPAETRAFAWVSLDRGDNVPAILWTSILRALEDAGAMPDAAGVIQGFADEPSAFGDAFPLEIVNRLVRHDGRVVLVLDNCHRVQNADCRRQLESFIDWLPANVQLAILSRAEPQLPLARFRASGDVLELGARQLSFTTEETDRFVRRLSNVQLSKAELDGLVERTEGWAAGVHLAALGMREHPDPAAFVRDFDGANRHVVDYFSEEVFAPFQDEMYSFLARTSILTAFTAPLCAAVAHSQNSGAIVAGLAQSNLFVIPLDEERNWYRYHPLFRGALHRLLLAHEPEMVTVLHERAGSWLERHGRIGDAVRHALGADDPDHAIRLIARNWPFFALSGTAQLATIASWVASVDIRRFDRDPVAAVCAAWITALSGDEASGRRWLDTARWLGHTGPLPDGAASLESSAALLESIMGTGGVHDMIASARTAVALESDPASRWYAMARCSLGCAHYLAGEYSAAITPLRDAAENIAAFPATKVQALAVLSLTTAELGRETQAAELAAASLALAETHELTGSAQMDIARMAMGASLTRHGHTAEARALLERVQEARRSSPRFATWPTLENLHLLISVQLDLGETAEARALAEEAAELLASLPADSGRLRVRHAQLQRQLNTLAKATVQLEPLTDREFAVLRLLRSEMSLREVGAELFVTQNTVKTHARAIYRKLEVSSRDEALRRAQDVGIL